MTDLLDNINSLRKTHAKYDSDAEEFNNRVDAYNEALDDVISMIKREYLNNNS